MANYILSCCSTADVTQEHLDKRDISYIPFHFFLDDVEYPDDLGKTIAYDDFYNQMKKGKSTRSAQINTDEYKKYFEKFLNNGQDIVHLCLSSGLSGTYNSALLAQQELEKKYPTRKIFVIDSLAASSGYGLFMDMLADLRDQGLTAEELAKKAIEMRLNIRHEFFSTDLTFYIKGGRVSKTAGLFGTILKICPILDMSVDGKLEPRKKVRGKKRAAEEVVLSMRERALNGADYNGKCYICHSMCIEDAEDVRNLVEKFFPNLKNKVEIYSIGTTIGSHTGPGTVALFYYGSPRID